MFRVEATPDFDREKWRGIVSGLDGNPLHLPEVLRPGIGDESIVHILVRRGDEIVGACLGLEWHARRLKILKGERHLRLATAPAHRGVERGDIYRALLEHAKRSGFETFEMGAGWGEDVTGLEPLAGHVKSAIVEFTIDLRKGMDEIMASMHKKHRKNVRTAAEARIEIEISRSLDTFVKLRDMQEASSIRATGRGNPYDIRDERFFRAAYRHVYESGPGSVLFAKKGGEHVAALAYLTFGKKAITVRSGATKAGYESNAMYLLQYDLFRRLKEEGCEEINIGGVPAGATEPSHPNHGLYNYKRYYGGTPCLRHEVEVPL